MNVVYAAIRSQDYDVQDRVDFTDLAAAQRFCWQWIQEALRRHRGNIEHLVIVRDERGGYVAKFLLQRGNVGYERYFACDMPVYDSVDAWIDQNPVQAIMMGLRKES